MSPDSSNQHPGPDPETSSGSGNPRIPGDSGSSPAAIPRKGYLYVAAAATLWAVSGSSGKFLFQSGVTPYELVQIRVTLASLCLLAWFLLRNPRLIPVARQDILYFMVLGICGMAMVQFTYFYAISKIHVAVAILLEYLAPTFIALYSVVVLRERLTRLTVIAVAGSTLGCYLAVGAYNLNLLSMNLEGILAGIASAIAFAWYAIHGERGMRRYDPWTVLFHALLYAAIFWNIALSPFHAFMRSYSPVQWGWILYISILGTAVPFGLYLEGINLIRSTRASVTATLEPIMAGFISYLFLGENLQPLQLLGGGIVLASVITLQSRKEFDANTPALIRERQKSRFRR
ncbi:MAG: EamA family transporter [Syntrophobacteraceae bacterium]|nr:EamA family transporter [Syntrophobacteraceae bacterium]